MFFFFFFWGDFLYIFDLKNVISTCIKDFCEKEMALIHLRMRYE